MRGFAVILLIVLASSLAIAAQAADTTTWPQSFSLYAGQSAKYTFQVSAAGNIVITSTWHGCGLYFVLKDPSGKVVAPVPLAVSSSPANVTYAATKADVAKGNPWTLIVETPPAKAPSQKPVAVGTVSVKVPLIGRLPIFHEPDVVKPPIFAAPPSISSVVPASGGPSDIVKVSGKSIPEDKTKAEVWFTVAGGLTRQGTILNVTKSAGIVTYEVRVPPRDNIQNSHDGPLYVRFKQTGAITNSLTFKYLPYPPPTITSHTPQYGMPGQRTTFTGTHFDSTNAVYFVVAGQSDISSPSTIYRSPTELYVTVPPNLPKANKTITCYVRGKAGALWQNGPRYSYSMDPAYINAKP